MDKGACCQDLWPEFDFWDPHGRRKDPTPTAVLSSSHGHDDVCTHIDNTQISIKHLIVKKINV